MPILIEEITRRYNRKIFDCGVDELNRFLQQQARQKTAKHISKTYVACQDSTSSIVLGYYTLTGYSVAIPPAHRDYKKYPHPLSAVKLARLAVDRAHQGQRVGERLLVDAIRKTVRVAQHMAVIGLFVDPTHLDIVPFYRQYGFLAADPEDYSRLEMWLPINSCEKVVK